MVRYFATFKMNNQFLLRTNDNYNDNYLSGRFSENAFVMNLATKRVKFYSWQSGVTSGQVKASLSIRCVNNMLSSPEGTRAS